MLRVIFASLVLRNRNKIFGKFMEVGFRTSFICLIYDATVIVEIRSHLFCNLLMDVII